MSEFGANFDRAQARYDAQEPDDDYECAEGGHRWRKTRVACIKGETIVEYRCTECGATKAE